jgi:hypothetical protein
LRTAVSEYACESAHLGHRELGGVQLVGGRHGAARGHDLDLVDVPAQLLAYRLADFILAVGDRSDHPHAAVDRIGPFSAAPLVAVAAGLRDVVAGDQQPRSREVPFFECETEPVVGAAGVARGREALHQAFFGAPHGAGRDIARRIVAMLVGDVLGHRADVHVGVSEPGHERGALAVERGDGSAQRAHLAARDHVLDAIVFHDDRRALDGIGAGAVDQQRIGQDRQTHLPTWGAPTWPPKPPNARSTPA